MHLYVGTSIDRDSSGDHLGTSYTKIAKLIKSRKDVLPCKHDFHSRAPDPAQQFAFLEI